MEKWSHGRPGRSQHEYLIVKMTDIIVTGVSHTGNADGA